MTLGKTGISLKRKFTDDNYGNYEFCFWSEETYNSDEDRQAVTHKLLEEAKARMVVEMKPFKKKGK